MVYAIPVQVQMGFVIQRRDMSIDHEEADTMMPNIAFSILQQGISPVHVKVDETNVFVLLIHGQCLILKPWFNKLIVE